MRGNVLFALLLSSAILAPATAFGQTTYSFSGKTTNATYNWSDFGNWTGDIAPPLGGINADPGDPTNTIRFEMGGTGGYTNYTVNNNYGALGDIYQVGNGQILFGPVSGSAGETRTLTLTGNPLGFNGGRITLNRNFLTVRIQNELHFAGDNNFIEIAGTGSSGRHIHLNGAIKMADDSTLTLSVTQNSSSINFNNVISGDNLGFTWTTSNNSSATRQLNWNVSATGTGNTLTINGGTVTFGVGAENALGKDGTLRVNNSNINTTVDFQASQIFAEGIFAVGTVGRLMTASTSGVVVQFDQLSGSGLTATDFRVANGGEFRLHSDTSRTVRDLVVMSAALDAVDGTIRIGGSDLTARAIQGAGVNSHIQLAGPQTFTVNGVAAGGVYDTSVTLLDGASVSMSSTLATLSSVGFIRLDAGSTWQFDNTTNNTQRIASGTPGLTLSGGKLHLLPHNSGGANSTLALGALQLWAGQSTIEIGRATVPGPGALGAGVITNSSLVRSLGGTLNFAPHIYDNTQRLFLTGTTDGAFLDGAVLYGGELASYSTGNGVVAFDVSDYADLDEFTDNVLSGDKGPYFRTLVDFDPYDVIVAAGAQELSALRLQGGVTLVGEDGTSLLEFVGTGGISNSGGVILATGTNNFIETNLSLQDARDLIVHVSGQSDQLQISGNLTGNGYLTKAGSGVLELTGVNEQAGTYLTGGTLAVDGDAALGAVAAGLTFSGNSTLQVFGSSDAEIDRAIQILSSSQANIDIAAGLATQISGDVGGAGSLTKLGDGTLNLTGTVNHTDGTTVDEGRLLVNTNNFTSNVTVNSGGTLGGGGTITGDVTINSGGFVAPGNSVDTLTVDGNYTLAGTYEWELGSLVEGITGGSGDWDFITVSGTAYLDGGLVALDFGLLGGLGPDSGNSFWFVDRTWDILTAGSLDGMLSLTGQTIFDFGYFDLSVLGNTVLLNYTATAAIPEPGSMLLLSLAAGGLGIHRLRRRRKSDSAA